MGKTKYDNYFNKDEIMSLYNSGLSTIAIAEKLNTKPQYVYRFMEYHNIKRRTHSESMKLLYKKNKYKLKKTYKKYSNRNINKENIIYYYFYKNLTMIEVSNKFNISLNHLKKLFKKHNIKKKIRNGKNNPHWKGGVMFDGKRKLLYKPNHPNSNFLGNYIYEYRYLMEQKLGRILDKKEIVHHINSDVTDNRIENLQIMKQSDHARLHHKKYNKKIIVCSICKIKFKQKGIRQKYCSRRCVSIYANRCKNEKR